MSHGGLAKLCECPFFLICRPAWAFFLLFFMGVAHGGDCPPGRFSSVWDRPDIPVSRV